MAKPYKYDRSYGDVFESKDFNNGHRGRKIRKTLLKKATKAFLKDQN
jgi:hypothetical protein